MADWFKFYENDLDETRLQYAVSKMPEVIPVWLGILSECCRHKVGTISWSSDEVEIFGFSRRLGLTADTVQRAVVMLVEIRYIECSQNLLTVLKWKEKQSEYCSKKDKPKQAPVPTVSRQCPDSVLLEERRGEEKRVERDAGEAHTPTWNEVKTLASMRAVPESSAKSFFDHHEGNGLWVNQYGRLINWHHKLTSWAANDRANPKRGTENTAPNIPTFAEQLPPMTKEELEAHRKKMLAKAMECDKPKTRTEGEE